MEQRETDQPGLFESIRRLGTTVIAIFQNRLELFTVELQEERIRIFDALLLMAIMVVLGFLGLVTATVAVMICLWHHFGMAGLLVLSGVYLLGAMLIYCQLRRRLKSWSFLSGTMSELKKDCACFGNKK